MNGKWIYQESQLAVLVCEDCGSEFFYAVALNRYAANAYSSMVGGDMQVIGNALYIRVCICGRPVVPVISGGRTGPGATEAVALVKMVEGALQNREKVPAALADLVAFSKRAVAKNQFDEAVGRLKAVEGAQRDQKKVAADLALVTKSQFDEMAGRLKALESTKRDQEKVAADLALVTESRFEEMAGHIEALEELIEKKKEKTRKTRKVENPRE